MTTSQPPDRVTTIYDAIDAFQRQFRTGGGLHLQHAQVRALLAGHLDRALPAAVPVPPTTHTTDEERRQRYADAIRETDGWVLDDGQHMIDAVMAVADAERVETRATVLRQAADQYAKLADQNEAYDREQGDLDEEARLQHGTVRDVVAGLRRMAAEASRPLTLATPCAVCKHPYNWHKAGVCQVDPCGCTAFAVDALAEEAQQQPAVVAELPASTDAGEGA